MSNVASLDNCRELYELSGWEDCYWWYNSLKGENPIVATRRLSTKKLVWATIPAYDAGYLLRKLPERTDDIRDTVLLGRATDNKGWSAVYRDFCGLGTTPENALAKLCILLFKSGVLTKEVL